VPLYCSGEEANQLGERLNGLSSELREGSRRARVVGIHQAASFASPPRGRPKSYGVDEVLSLMYEYLKSCAWKPTWDTIAELSSLAGLSADSDSIRHRVKKYRTQVAAPPTSSNLHWQNHSYRVHIEELSADLELDQ